MSKQSEVVLQLVSDELGICVERFKKGGQLRYNCESRARQYSIYLLVIVCEMKQASVARLFSISRAAIVQTLQRIEELRSNQIFDNWIERLELQLTEMFRGR